MAARVVAIIGTYRKSGITDQTVQEVLRAVRNHGGQTETIYLLDEPIEFCTNCRACTQDPDVGTHGPCIHDDALAGILERIDAADGLVLASPTNFFTVTALMKRFIERLLGYAYWPWTAAIPKPRIRTPHKKAVTITSTACPALMARLLIRHPTSLLKKVARLLGARVVDTLHIGLAAQQQDQHLSDTQKRRAYRAGCRLANRLNTVYHNAP